MSSPLAMGIPNEHEQPTSSSQWKWTCSRHDIDKNNWCVGVKQRSLYSSSFLIQLRLIEPN
jgi:hypothetical protein